MPNGTGERRPFDPRATMFTNLALDEIMPQVSPNAWKILSFAIRKTRGWVDSASPTGRKESDVISISQFQKGTGIKSGNTVNAAIAECIGKGYLIRHPEGQSYRYSLDIDYELPPETPSKIEVVAETPSKIEVVTPSKIEVVGAKTPSKIEGTNSNLNNKRNCKDIYPPVAAPRASKPTKQPREPRAPKKHDAATVAALERLAETESVIAPYREAFLVAYGVLAGDMPKKDLAEMAESVLTFLGFASKPGPQDLAACTCYYKALWKSQDFVLNNALSALRLVVKGYASWAGERPGPDAVKARAQSSQSGRPGRPAASRVMEAPVRAPKPPSEGFPVARRYTLAELEKMGWKPGMPMPLKPEPISEAQGVRT